MSFREHGNGKRTWETPETKKDNDKIKYGKQNTMTRKPFPGQYVWRAW